MLSPAQFAEWAEFYELEPWGFGVDDVRGGVLASTIAATAGSAMKPSDFFLKPPPEEVEDEGADLLKSLKKLIPPLPHPSTPPEKL